MSWALLLGIEPALQDDGSGHFVDDLLAPRTRHVRGQQNCLGLDGAEALVDELDRDVDGRPQTLGEGLDAPGRPAPLALGRQRQAQHHPPGRVGLDQRGDRLEIAATPAALEGAGRLRAQTQPIGQRHADPTCAEIESDHPCGHAADTST